MKFYDILQWDPQVTKMFMKKKIIKKEKMKLASGMFMRSLLIVLFAIVFISGLTAIFGSKNTPMAVAVFCILLGVRFVDFGYCIKDALLMLSLAFFLLLVSPVIADSVFPLWGFVIHLISFFIILFVTCDKPEMGNGGLFSFAYIYLSGNPVYGQDFIQRIMTRDSSTPLSSRIVPYVFRILFKDFLTIPNFRQIVFSRDVKVYVLIRSPFLSNRYSPKGFN